MQHEYVVHTCRVNRPALSSNFLQRGSSLGMIRLDGMTLWKRKMLLPGHSSGGLLFTVACYQRGQSHALEPTGSSFSSPTGAALGENCGDGMQGARAGLARRRPELVKKDGTCSICGLFLGRNARGAGGTPSHIEALKPTVGQRLGRPFSAIDL